MSLVFIIDDDPIHLRIAEMIIGKSMLFDSHTGFLEAESALKVLSQNKESPLDLPDVILLDLNMPVVNGWLFLDRYTALAESLSKVSEIYIVSSSVDQNDKLLAKTYTHVKGFISKPMSVESLYSFLAPEKLG